MQTSEQEVLTPEVVIEESNAALITQEDGQALIATLSPLRERVEKCRALSQIVVKDQATALEAKALRDQIAKERKIVSEAIAAHKEAAFAKHKLWSRFEGWFLDPMTAAYKMIGTALDKYDAEQRAAAEKERQRIQAIADEKARREREAAEQAAAKQRAIEDEARRKADEARRQAENASAEERKRLNAEADKADREAERAAAKASAKTEQAAAVVAPTLNVEAQTSGKIARKVVVATVTDSKAFFSACAVRHELTGYVEINTTAMQRARSANPMLEIPGVTFSHRTV